MQKQNEGNIVMTIKSGNCHINFHDDYVLRDEELIVEQVHQIEDIIYNGLSKVASNVTTD